jgi:hypothetical protein
MREVRHHGRVIDEEPWYAVRSLSRSTPGNVGGRDTPPGTSYEERITLWRASSADEAIFRAEQEAREYAETVGSEHLGLAQSYHLFEDPDDGLEVFSLVRNSDLAPDDYINRFFDTGDERQREH